jgi:hypothetical protein
MHDALTLDEVLDAGLPAIGGEIYLFSPDAGFYRATTARLAPAWLPIPWPAHGDQVLWRHEEDCACRFCDRPATRVTTIRGESEAEKAELSRTA